MGVTEFLGQYVVGVIVASVVGGFTGGFFVRKKYETYLHKRSEVKYKVIVKGRGNTVNVSPESYNPFAFKE